MSIPFSYGKIVESTAFVNRSEDILHLENNFKSLNNTILISPRRWGKSSLVKKVALKVTSKKKNYKICFLDLYKIRSEEDFYKSFAETVINSTNTKLDETIKNIKLFFTAFIPKISINPDPQSEISLSMDWKAIVKNPDQILNLPEYIAKKKKIKIIVCLDEFQNIMTFKNPDAFQKKLRASWQHHSNVSYCIYGSKRNMMLQLFSDASMPFYKFGDLMFLSKISTKHWSNYIVRQFKKTGKTITHADASYLVGLVQNHSYYVQQLAQKTWLITNKDCSQEVINQATNSLLSQMALLFQQITDTLSNKQINFLKAHIAGANPLSSKENIIKYDLGTSSTVVRSKNALEDKGILDLFGNEIHFNDPVYELWLNRFYFN